jgi:hypothetical protein
VDLRDEKAARQAVSPLTDVRHVAYAAIYENADDLVSGWSSAAQIEANNAMLHNVIDPSCRQGLDQPQQDHHPIEREAHVTATHLVVADHRDRKEAGCACCEPATDE